MGEDCPDAVLPEQLRSIPAALGVWLFISAFVLPGSSHGTLWNNALVGLAIFVVSLTPSSDRPQVRAPTT